MPRIIAQNRLSRVTIGNRPITFNPAVQAGPPPLITGTSFDPATANGLIVLSNNNLTVTLSAAGAGTWRAVRSQAGKTSGKYHWEMRFNSITAGGGSWNCGIVRTAAFNNALFCGQDANGIGANWGGGIVVNGAGIAPCDQLSVGDTLELEIDLNAKLMWGRRVGRTEWNQNPLANPVTGVGGASFAAMVGPFAPVGSHLEQSVTTFNFGAQPMIGNVSPGYMRGWPL